MKIDAKTAAAAHDAVNEWFSQHVKMITGIVAASGRNETGDVTFMRDAWDRYDRGLAIGAEAMRLAHEAIEKVKEPNPF